MPNIYYYIDFYENQLLSAKRIANWDEVSRLNALIVELKDVVTVKAPKLPARN